MNTQVMRYFIVLADERNYTRAAQRLFITQQSLSASISRLEEELNCQLVLRQTPLELTRAGSVFLRYARSSVSMLENVQREILDLASDPVGILRIGASFSRSQMFMPAMVKAFTHSHPNIRLGVYENTDMVERLADGELDLVLTRALERSPRIEYENFYVERTVLTIGKGLADKLCLDPAEITVSLERDHLNALRECPFIFHQPHGDTQSIFLQMASHSDFTPRCCCEIFGTSTILKLTLDNIGASFNPASMVNNFLTPEEQKQLYIFPLPEKYNYLIQFAYRRQRYQWSIIQDFMCTARNLFPISESFCLRI